MIARLIETSDSKLQLLCDNGSISEVNDTILYNFLLNFAIADTFYGTEGSWKEESEEMAMVEGKTIAFVTDNKQLVVSDFSPFIGLIKPTNFRYITVEEFAEKNNRSAEMIKVYLRQNRIAGAQKLGKSWMIPENAPYPVSPEHQREVSPNVGRPKKNR